MGIYEKENGRENLYNQDTNNLPCQEKKEKQKKECHNEIRKRKKEDHINEKREKNKLNSKQENKNCKEKYKRRKVEPDKEK